MLLPEHTWEGIAAGPIVIAVRRGGDDPRGVAVLEAVDR
jgi:hypothetical protein